MGTWTCFCQMVVVLGTGGTSRHTQWRWETVAVHATMAEQLCAQSPWAERPGLQTVPMALDVLSSNLAEPCFWVGACLEVSTAESLRPSHLSLVFFSRRGEARGPWRRPRDGQHGVHL